MSTLEQKLEQYERLLERYEASLSKGDRAAIQLAFDNGAQLWAEIAEDELRKDAAWNASTMHLVLTFSHAVAARDAVEAKRLYDLLGPDDRQSADSVTLDDGKSIRIWEEKRGS